jgi:hypothetical protein
MTNKTLTEKTEDTSTDIRFIKGGLVKGKLEKGADGITRRIIETHDKGRYYIIKQNDKGNWVTESPIYPITP